MFGLPIGFVVIGSLAAMLFFSAHLYLQMWGIKRDAESGKIVHSHETAIVVCTFWAIVLTMMYFFGFFKVFIILWLISIAIEAVRAFIRTI
jgi:hypothetical protein